MSVSILEGLQNAQINLVENAGHPIAKQLGKAQLRNAITLLEKGYPVSTEVEPLLEQYGDVDAVPEYRQETPYPMAAPKIEQSVPHIGQPVQLTFRQQAAIHAMQGLLASGNRVEVGELKDTTPEIIGKAAWAYADALLASEGGGT